MAIDNRQRVGEALAILRKGLLPYVQRELKMRYKARWWIDGVEPALKDKERVDARRSGSTEKEWFQSLDTQKLLRVMWVQWKEVFRQKLDQIGRAYVSELREFRNRWAHEEPFSLDDTFRAINTVTRFLQMLAPDYAEEAARLEREVLRLLSEEEGKREVGRRIKAPDQVATPDRLEPQPEVVTPHPVVGLIDRARDVLQSGQSAIVIFTDGREFKHTPDGRGHTGYWVMDPKRPFEKVIIYRRDQKSGTNEVWTATPYGIIPAPEPHSDRYIIYLSSVKRAGTTGKKWFPFAETGPNPIRYLTKP